MKFLLGYEKFFEARFLDIFKSDNDMINQYKKNFDYNGEFLKYFSVRINNKKNRFELNYNHSENHDLKKRIEYRTSLKSIEEFNILFKKILNELFIEKISDVKESGVYTLYISEYDFSIIVNINLLKNKIFLKTITSGLNTLNRNNNIEINSIL